MKQNKPVYTLTVLVLALLFMSTAVAAPTLKFTFKDVKVKGAVEVDTYSINDKGVIAGDYVDSSANQHGMILNGTKLTSFDDKNCPSSPAGSTAIAMYGINSAGVAVGWCTSSKTGSPVGLMYAKGKLTELTVPKSIETEADGINDKGEIVGTFIDSAGAQHGFLLANKKYKQLDVPGDSSTVAWSINAKGQITLYAINSAGNYDAFILTGKKYTKVSDPNSASPGTVIHAINNNGDVDGTYYDSSGVTHGFLLTGGKYYTLNDPEGADTRADGLNDKLTIVGRWGSGTYGGTGFEATTKK